MWSVNTTRVAGLVGSLQKDSANSAIMRSAIKTAAPSLSIAVFSSLAQVPLFNADLAGDDEAAPPAVRALRKAIASANGVLISTPEYGHSLPGALKNALDWLVGSGELANKRVAAISASPTPTGGLRALTALVQTLLAQHADVIALLPIAAIRTALDESGEVADVVVQRRIAETVAALADPPALMS